MTAVYATSIRERKGEREERKCLSAASLSRGIFGQFHGPFRITRRRVVHNASSRAPPPPPPRFSSHTRARGSNGPSVGVSDSIVYYMVEGTPGSSREKALSFWLVKA